MKEITITPEEGLAALNALMLMYDSCGYIRDDIDKASKSLYEKLKDNEDIKECLNDKNKRL